MKFKIGGTSLFPFQEDRLGPELKNAAEYHLSDYLVLLSYVKSKEKACNFIDWEKRSFLSPSQDKQNTLIVDCSKFPSIGPESISRFIAHAYKLGWKRFVTFGWQGQKSCGGGLGSKSNDVRIEVWGTPGDNLASGLDGAEIIVHGSAKDQVAQKMKNGKLVFYGNVGHNFMKNSKGGEAYVLGNVSGKPMINATGFSKVVINGTCLDHSDDSNLTDETLKRSGVIILNGLTYDDQEGIKDMEDPYSDHILLSLARNGATYIRDPLSRVKENWNTGMQLRDLSEKECLTLLPCLKENEKLFDIDILDLITTDNKLRPFHQVYRKVELTEPNI